MSARRSTRRSPWGSAGSSCLAGRAGGVARPPRGRGDKPGGRLPRAAAPDATLPRVRTSLAELARTDGVPFEYALRAGVGSVMSAFVAYPEWDRSERAASFSPEILGYLRDTLNFSGLVVTDALIMAGASAAQPVPAATVQAVAAGCDALLYPDDFRPLVAPPARPGGGAILPPRADQAPPPHHPAPPAPPHPSHHGPPPPP